MAMRIEIVIVGREPVSGRMVDTNSFYMAEKFFSAGIMVKRITMVGDDVDDIASSIREVIHRGANVLLLSGGIGPAPGDRTFQMVAEVAGVGMLMNPGAVKMVQNKYEELFSRGLVPSPEMTSERLKMATLPEGAQILENHLGAAPGIKMKVGLLTLYCLPGVPKELEGMFDNTVFPEIMRLYGGGAVVVKRVLSRFGDESVVSGIVNAVAKKYPSIYIKTKPEKFGGEVKISVEFIAQEEERGDDSGMEGAVEYFQKLEEDALKGESENE